MAAKASATPDDIMSAAELKPILMKSKAEPVMCALALTAEKDAVLLASKKGRPRKLASQLRTDAAKAKLELQAATIRFGTAEVDPDVDATLVVFRVNKAVPGNFELKFKERTKKAGLSRVQFVVDESLDAEPEEEGVPPPPPGAPPAQPVADARPAAQERAPAGAMVAVTKSILLWDATRKHLVGQVAALGQAIIEGSADEADADAIRAAVPALDEIFAKLDTRLSDTLGAMQKAEADARPALRQDAKAIVAEYRAYIAGEPLMAALDANPFLPFDGVARVSTALQAIDATL